MKVFGQHFYLGNPDSTKEITKVKLKYGEPTTMNQEGPKKILPGLYVGKKSLTRTLRKIREDESQATGPDNGEQQSDAISNQNPSLAHIADQHSFLESDHRSSNQSSISGTIIPSSKNCMNQKTLSNKLQPNWRLAINNTSLPPELTFDIAKHLHRNAVLTKAKINGTLASNDDLSALYNFGNSQLRIPRSTVLWLAKQNTNLALDLLKQNYAIRHLSMHPQISALTDDSPHAELFIATLALASIDHHLIKKQIAQSLPRKGGASPSDPLDVNLAKNQVRICVEEALEKIKTNWSEFKPERDEQAIHSLELLALGCKSLAKPDIWSLAEGEENKELLWSLQEIEKGLNSLNKQPEQQVRILKALAAGFPLASPKLNNVEHNCPFLLFTSIFKDLNTDQQLSVLEDLPKTTPWFGRLHSGLRPSQKDQLFDIYRQLLEKIADNPEQQFRVLSSIFANGEPVMNSAYTFFSKLNLQQKILILASVENQMNQGSISQQAKLLVGLIRNYRQLTPAWQDKNLSYASVLFDAIRHSKNEEHKRVIASVVPHVIGYLHHTGNDSDAQQRVMRIAKNGLEVCGNAFSKDSAKMLIDSCALGKFCLENSGRIGKDFTKNVVTLMSGDQLLTVYDAFEEKISGENAQETSMRLKDDYKSAQSYIVNLAQSRGITLALPKKSSTPG